MAQSQLVSDLRDYVRVCWHHWRFLLTSSGFVVILAMVERYTGLNLNVVWYFGLVFVLLLYAGFLAWRDERRLRSGVVRGDAIHGEVMNLPVAIAEPKRLPAIADLKLFFSKANPLCYQAVPRQLRHPGSHVVLRIGITNRSPVPVRDVRIKVVGTTPTLNPPLFGYCLASYPDHQEVIEVPPSGEDTPQMYVDLADVTVSEPSPQDRMIRWSLFVGEKSILKDGMHEFKVQLRIEHASGVQDHWSITFGSNGTEVKAGLTRVKSTTGELVRDPWEESTPVP